MAGARKRRVARCSRGCGVQSADHLGALVGIQRVELGYWRRTGSSRSGRRLLERSLRKAQNLIHLVSTNGRKPLQKLVDGRALLEMLEERGDRQTRTAKAPGPAELSRGAIDSAANAPVHSAILSSLLGDVVSHRSPSPPKNKPAPPRVRTPVQHPVLQLDHRRR
jgi:hypothetical protein